MRSIGRGIGAMPVASASVLASSAFMGQGIGRTSVNRKELGTGSIGRELTKPPIILRLHHAAPDGRDPIDVLIIGTPLRRG